MLIEGGREGLTMLCSDRHIGLSSRLGRMVGVGLGEERRRTWVARNVDADVD